MPTEEALASWRAVRRTSRGGQPRYSGLAIETVLTLGCVFGLRLRQSEGLMLSLLDMMELDLPVPDHTTLSRRAPTWEPPVRRQRHAEEDGPLHVLVDSSGLKVYGAGQWLAERHRGRSRRRWRKLHLVLDADSGEGRWCTEAALGRLGSLMGPAMLAWPGSGRTSGVRTASCG